MRAVLHILALLSLVGCNDQRTATAGSSLQTPDSLLPARHSRLAPEDNTALKDTSLLPVATEVHLEGTDPEAIADFAETLIGVPYVYASSDPERGFDCSGFITYVFNHFRIPVPRSSIDFTHVGKEVPVGQAGRGDIILFTGTDSADRHVGHMGLVVSAPGSDTLRFIHSTSGKAMGVTITPLNQYYRGRFVKTIRLPD